MIKKKYLGLIPARGGSKGIPHKNIYPLNNKPLISYTIEAGLYAKEHNVLDKVVVTTEDEEIARVSLQFGAEVPFLRPYELATDNSKSIDCMIHAIKWYEERGEKYDAVVLLQPTSPLRTGQDIIDSITLFEKMNKESLVSCYMEESISEYNSYHLDGDVGVPLVEDHNKGMRRQDIPNLYVRNGAIFITSTEYLLNKQLVIADSPIVYVMPKNRSANIDTQFDMDMVERLMDLEK